MSSTGCEAGGPLELGPIRPPSEAYSLLIRVTRNCPWNRCKFCRTYKGLKFSLRSVDEIKRDIQSARAVYDRIEELSRHSGNGGGLREAAAGFYRTALDDGSRQVALWLYGGAETAFLQDANSLIMPTDELVEVITFLKATFPSINRVTSYARSHTVCRKKPEELARLREAGLTRIHIGLETGYDALLEYVDKGVTAGEHIAAGKKVVESGISLSEYIILGLGGKKMWREHALETARVLNEINPDFIRVRTLDITKGMPLKDEADSGRFLRSTDEDIVAEEKLLIENLTCSSYFVSDHVTNLLQEIEGRLPEDRDRMLGVIGRFQALGAADRLNFAVGRRMGVYGRLDDMDSPERRRAVEGFIQRSSVNDCFDESVLYRLMEGFI